MLILSILMFKCPCRAGVDLYSTQPLEIPRDDYTPRITSSDIEKFIPLDVKKTDSTDRVLGRIMDRTVNIWLKSSTIKNSSLGRAIDKTQETLKTDVVIKAQNPHEISHKLTFKVDAFQTEAKVEYKGLLDANFNYNFSNAESIFQVSDKVFDDKNLVFSYKNNHEQALSMIGLAWSW